VSFNTPPSPANVGCSVQFAVCDADAGADEADSVQSSVARTVYEYV